MLDQTLAFFLSLPLMYSGRLYQFGSGAYSTNFIQLPLIICLHAVLI